MAGMQSKDGMRGIGISLEQAFEAVLDDDVFLDLMRGYARRIGAKGFAAGFSLNGNTVDSIFAYENDWSTDMLADYTAHFAHKDPWTLNITPGHRKGRVRRCLGLCGRRPVGTQRTL